MYSINILFLDILVQTITKTRLPIFCISFWKPRYFLHCCFKIPIVITRKIFSLLPQIVNACFSRSVYYFLINYFLMDSKMLFQELLSAFFDTWYFTTFNTLFYFLISCNFLWFSSFVCATHHLFMKWTRHLN